MISAAIRMRPVTSIWKNELNPSTAPLRRWHQLQSGVGRGLTDGEPRGQPCCLGVAADRVDVLTESGAAQHQTHDHGGDHEDQPDDRNAGDSSGAQEPQADRDLCGGGCAIGGQER